MGKETIFAAETALVKEGQMARPEGVAAESLESVREKGCRRGVGENLTLAAKVIDDIPPSYRCLEEPGMKKNIVDKVKEEKRRRGRCGAKGGGKGRRRGLIQPWRAGNRTTVNWPTGRQARKVQCSLGLKGGGDHWTWFVAPPKRGGVRVLKNPKVKGNGSDHRQGKMCCRRLVFNAISVPSAPEEKGVPLKRESQHQLM